MTNHMNLPQSLTDSPDQIYLDSVRSIRSKKCD